MGLLGDVYDGVAGVADHAAGSVDESIGRQFDDQVGGGFADVTETGDPAEEDTDGDGQPDAYNNRYLQGEVVRNWFDTIQEYDGTLNGSEDSVDVMGPAAWGTSGSVSDVLVSRDGESTSGEFKTRALLYGAVALVVLYLVRPLLELGAGVADG